uniref:Variant surface glycoprotein 1044 n=1 Tax=Trypanosoma brucei TaxID=5691 RepID=M4SXG9_9TRYP|nr:variant surface glycoprotein 1044 [Trypanosoma brucei]APD73324.1 variant surface glycoprotein 1125.1052 [Trypanosoma brucei]
MTYVSYVITVLAAFAATIKQSSGTADGNAKEHGVMCHIQVLAASQAPAIKIEPDKGNTLQMLEELNLSTSDYKWKAIFNTALEEPAGEQMPKEHDASPHAEQWRKAWKSWWTAAKSASKNKLGTKEHGKYKGIQDEYQRQAAHAVIEQATTQAQALQAEYNIAKTQATKTLPQQIQSELNAALYGGIGTVKAVDTTNTLRGTGGWTTTCSAANAGTSIAGDFLCLCNGADSGDGNCPGGYTQADWSGGVSQTATKWAALTATCPTQEKPEITPENIAAAIHAFASTLQRKTNGAQTKVRLGESSDHSRDGTSSKLCIDYSNHFVKATGAGIKGITWVKHLYTASSKLKKQAEAAQRAATIGHQVASLETKADLVYRLASQNLLQKAAPAVIREQKSTTSYGENNKNNQCPIKNSTAADCSPDLCNYNTQTQECKPKPGKENSAAGTGDRGAGGAAPAGCARHGNDKTACENDKTEDKQNCAWRKGKEGAPDQEKEMC